MSGDNEINDDVDSLYVDSFLEVTKKPVFDSYFLVGDLLNRTEVFRHPFDYMTTLVQIGYEPLPPTLTTSIFGRPQYRLPGFYTYLKFIANTDGFLGLWRGLGYNMTHAITSTFVYCNVSQWQKENVEIFKPLKQSHDAKYKNSKNLVLSLSLETISKFASFVVAYPFHVMMVRSMAQFIGRETHYDSVFSAIADIYQTGGLAGFYAGIGPCFFGECLLLLIESGLIYLLKSSNQVDKMFYPFIVSSISIVARSLIYPFRIVSTVMACNGPSARSLAASAYTAPEYVNWIQCWSTLYHRGDLKRGSSLFWRYQPLSSTYAFSLRPLTPIELKAKKFN